MLFKRQLAVDKLEREFKTEEMRNRSIFYDINLRSDDPENLRNTITELMHDTDFDPDINELVQFEDVELDKVLKGGRLKPIKAILRGYKYLNGGVKYTLLWKLLAFLGSLSLFIYFAEEIITYQLTDKNMFLKAAGVLFLLAILIRLIKERVKNGLWIKIVGLYNVQDEKSDVRVIISAEAKEGNEKLKNKLKAEVLEIYNALAAKYTKSKPATLEKIIIKEKNETADISVMKSLRDVEKEKEKLDSRIVNGEISEDIYRELKEKLDKKHSKLQTLLDLIS